MGSEIKTMTGWLLESAHLVLRPCGHDGAGLLGTELSDGAVQHVDLVEEVHSVDSNPLIEIFSFWQHHSQA